MQPSEISAKINFNLSGSESFRKIGKIQERLGKFGETGNNGGETNNMRPHLCTPILTTFQMESQSTKPCCIEFNVCERSWRLWDGKRSASTEQKRSQQSEEVHPNKNLLAQMRYFVV